MPAAGETFLKTDSSNMQKQRKVAHRRHFFEIWYFSNPGEWISFMRVQPPAPPLNFRILEPPSTFETPKVQPPFSKRGFELCSSLYFSSSPSCLMRKSSCMQMTMWQVLSSVMELLDRSYSDTTSRRCTQITRACEVNDVSMIYSQLQIRCQQRVKSCTLASKAVLFYPIN